MGLSAIPLVFSKNDTLKKNCHFYPAGFQAGMTIFDDAHRTLLKNQGM